MDKNFINIDDLVRQRLGGGEEQERSGAWANMRDLLDREMPQEKDRAGFFFWRRMMGAIAVLLVIASITVGGYELAATRGAAIAKSNDVALPATNARATNASANEVTNAQVTAQGDDGQPKDHSNNTGNKQPLMAANTPRQDKERKHVIAKAPAVAATQQEVAAARVVADNDNSKPATDAPIAAAAPIKAVAVAEDANNKAVVKTTTKTAHAGTHNKTTTSAIHEKATASATKHSAPAANPVAATNNDNDNNNPVAKTATKQGAPANNSVAETNSDNDNNKPVAITTTKQNHKSAAKPAGNKVAAAKKATAPAIANKTKGNSAQQQKMAALALSSSLTNTRSPKAGKGTAVAVPQNAVVKTTGHKALAGNTAIPAGKKAGKAPIAVAHKTIEKKAITVDKDKATDGKVASTQPAPVPATPAVAAASSKTTAPVKAISPADNPALKNTYALNVKKNKRVIQKLVLYDHHIKTDPNDNEHNLDTISMETLTQELGVAAENNPYLPVAKKSAARTPPATAGTAANKNEGAADNEVASTSSTANAQILPGAAASVNGKAAGTTASKQSGGAAALENLNATFNDIKYHVKGVQFAAGLSAGINGTFFGPTSFKGFQFGVTGDFIFSDAVSLVAELKYFHRVNNNYSMEDDYYTYTGPSGGPYTRQQIANSYAFSTLHSLEMPLIVRYTAGKFSFFLGGNIVYSFSINEGESIPQPGTTTTVMAKGNDQNAKLDASDFNSRFGFGCLFGVSFKVAPNTTLDIRNVQTLWDNANSEGAKYVSQQLYKSPSLQLSLNYRLGGNKIK